MKTPLVKGLISFNAIDCLFRWFISWYPPGHGDFYDTFRSSGLLKKFIDEGREYCFLSNIDNLGATVDLNILNKLVGEERSDKPAEFVMEVTDKTRADVKVRNLMQNCKRGLFDQFLFNNFLKFYDLVLKKKNPLETLYWELKVS